MGRRGKCRASQRQIHVYSPFSLSRPPPCSSPSNVRKLEAAPELPVWKGLCLPHLYMSFQGLVVKTPPGDGNRFPRPCQHLFPSCAVGRLEGRVVSPTPTPGLCITSGQRQNRKRRENWGGEHVPEGRRLSKNIQGYRDGGRKGKECREGQGEKHCKNKKKRERE